MELKLKAVGAAAEEEEGSGVLTARGKVAEVVAGAELAEVDPGKLNESDEAAAAAPDAGAGLNPNEGAAKQVHDSRIQNSVKLINSRVDRHAGEDTCCLDVDIHSHSTCFRVLHNRYRMFLSGWSMNPFCPAAIYSCLATVHA